MSGFCLKVELGRGGPVTNRANLKLNVYTMAQSYDNFLEANLPRYR